MTKDVPSYWRNLDVFLRLQGSKCKKCGKKFLPPKKACPSCKSTEMESYIAPRTGKVLSWSVITEAPTKFKKYAPYVLGLVELEDGNRIIAQLTDVKEKELEFGMPVKGVVRRFYEDGEGGLIHYGYKFVPKEFQED